MNEAWLKKYYGRDFDDFTPSVYMETERFAVVRIAKAEKGRTSRLGFVLIRKNGQHNSSSQVSMFEGVPTSDVLDRFREALEKAERDGI